MSDPMEESVDLIDDALQQVKSVLENSDTLIAFLLDRSGSMASIRQPTIDGYNEFLGEQRKAPGNAWVSRYQFDTDYQTDVKEQPIDQADYLDFDTFEPRGGTALYDGIAKTITNVENSVNNMNPRPGSVLVVIMTDGAENSSQEYAGPAGAAKIKALTEEKQAKDGWDFVYLGANQDAFVEAGKIGIPKGFAAQYASNRGSTQAVFAATSQASTQYRTAGSKGLRAAGQSLSSTGGSFFGEDQQDVTDEK